MTGLLVPLAHAGHWINGLLYLTPVLIIGLLLFIQSRHESGDEADAPDEQSAPDESGDD